MEGITIICPEIFVGLELKLGEASRLHFEYQPSALKKLFCFIVIVIIID